MNIVGIIRGSKIGAKAIHALSVAKIGLVQASPVILIAAGAAAVVGGVVAACCATRKVDDILAEHKEKMEQIDEVLEKKDEIPEASEYTNEDAKHDRNITVVQTAWKLVKLYAPSALLITAGLGCIFFSHHLMVVRLNGALAALSALQAANNEYQKRVKGEIGEEREAALRENMENEKNDGNRAEPYVICLSRETSEEWNDDPTYMFTFLKKKEHALNVLLQVKPMITCKDICDELGIRQVPAWAPVMVYLNNPAGGKRISFGIRDYERAEAQARQEYEMQPIYITLHPDGNMYDKEFLKLGRQRGVISCEA